MKVLALKIDESGNLINAITNDIVLSSDSLFGDGNWKTVDGALYCISNSTVTKSNIPFNVANFNDYDKIEIYFSLFLPSSMERSKKYCFISVDIDPEERNSSFLLYKPASTDYIALYTQGTRVWTQNSFGYLKGIISIEKTSDTEVSEYVKLIGNDNTTLYESTYTTSTFDGNFYFTTGTDSYFTGTYYYQSGTIFYPDVSDLLTSPKVAYYQLLENPANNLKGTWEITSDGYLSVTGMTNGSTAMFDLGKGLLDFELEYTCKAISSGGNINSPVIPILRYDLSDEGIEGGGNNYALYPYICTYENLVGTFNLRDRDGTKNTKTVRYSITKDVFYKYKLVRKGGTISFYVDDVLYNEKTDFNANVPLYLGWYLWYGGLDGGYQTNFILSKYSLIFNNDTRISVLDKDGLSVLWNEIKNRFVPLPKSTFTPIATDTWNISGTANSYTPSDNGYLYLNVSNASAVEITDVNGTIYSATHNGDFGIRILVVKDMQVDFKLTCDAINYLRFVSFN